MISRLFACFACVSTLILVVLMLQTPGRAIAPNGEVVSRPARGRVFHDANNNGTYDAGEELLSNIRVSNGREIALTDEQGQFALTVDDDDILFVIKPRGWRTPVDELQLPRFYYIHKPHGSPPNFRFAGVEPTGDLPASVDFPLYKQDEPEHFKALLFGDTQPRNIEEVEYISHDVVEELIGTDASFGVTLGDIVFDDLSVFSSLNKTIALIGIPWYNVIGNHDINYDARVRQQANETYERVYGPSYYSFDYGQVHFIVVDNIEWLIDSGTGKGRYQGGLGDEQLQFIKNDLALIPEDQMVVLMMHIPLTDTNDRHGLYRLIEQRPFCISISGHTHHHEHKLISTEDGWMGPEPHHHIVNVTVCGSWWSGAKDERGIPHTMMADGAPNGYSILTFDGAKYTLDFKAAGRPAEYQMHIDTPEEISVDALSETPVFVNVFNGHKSNDVQMRLGDGDWQSLQWRYIIDPHFKRVYEDEAKILATNKAWRELPKPKGSTHLWQGTLPADLAPGTYLIEVRATDLFGREVTGNRVFKVIAAQAEAQ